jgi:hypothetical protein
MVLFLSSSAVVYCAVCRMSKSKSSYDRRSVGQFLSMSGTHLGPLTNYSSIFNYFSTVTGLLMWAPSLTRGGSAVYYCCWASPAQSFLGTYGHILHSQFWDSVSLDGQVPVFIFHKNWVVQLYTKALGYSSKSSQNYLTTDGLSASILVSGHHLGPAIIFSMELIFRHLRFLLLWGTLPGKMMDL